MNLKWSAKLCDDGARRVLMGSLVLTGMQKFAELAAATEKAREMLEVTGQTDYGLAALQMLMAWADDLPFKVWHLWVEPGPPAAEGKFALSA